MRVRKLFAAKHLFLSEIFRHSPSPTGMAGVP